MGSSLAGREGSVIKETSVAASPWNSFCVVEGSEAGAIGADGESGFTQQAGVAQCLLSHPVQQQLFFTLCVVADVCADDAMTPCQARTNPSRSTTAILIGRDVMFGDWSL